MVFFKCGANMLFIVIVLLISTCLYPATDVNYPYNTIKNKKIFLNEMTGSYAPWDIVYRQFASPLLHNTAVTQKELAGPAGSFLMSNCAISEDQCKNCLDILLVLREALEDNNILLAQKITAIINHNSVDTDNAITTTSPNLLQDHGIPAKEYTRQESWLIPNLIPSLHKSSKIMKEHGCAHEVGAYFLHAYAKSITDGDNAYSFLRTLKQAIEKNPHNPDIVEYKQALKNWYLFKDRKNQSS